MKKGSLTLITIFLILAASSKAYAVGSGGLSNQVAGAKALSMGNAFAAQADDLSAITFNPAGLTQVKESGVSLGATFQLPSTDYESSSGVSDSTVEHLFVTPNMYLYKPNAFKEIGVGLGITSPFGLGIEWGKASPLRLAATNSEMAVIDINPTVAFEITPAFSFGFGVNYFYAKDTEISKQLDVAFLNTGLGAPDTAPEGSSTLTGDGDGWGFNVGLQYKPNKNHRVGLAYRSNVNVNYKGDVSMKGLSGASEALFGGADYKNSVRTTVSYPQIVTLGYAYNIKENWTVETDIEWTGWASMKEQNIRYSEEDPTRLAVLNADNPTPKEWENVFSFALGTEYILDNKLALRFGYFFFDSPVPEKTFDPSLPDGKLNGFAFGIGYPFKSVIIDIGYQFLTTMERNIDNDVGTTSNTTVDGKYKSIFHYIAANLTFLF